MVFFYSGDTKTNKNSKNFDFDINFSEFIRYYK